MSLLKHSRLLVVVAALLSFTASAAEDLHWVASWGASPFNFGGPGRTTPPAPLVNQTLRQKLRLSVGGEQVRIRFSNELGKTPLKIGAASVALAAAETAVDKASLHTVTFGGQQSIVIPAGAPALSDPIDLKVADLGELSISLYLPETTEAATMHMGRTSYVSTAGDFTQAASLDGAELTTNLQFITGVYVGTAEQVNVVVAFGDSITDGTRSTPHTYSSWPDNFAARVSTGKNGRKLAVVNEGISGNQVLNDGAGISALARFDRDVLSNPGVTHMVVLEGINDLGTSGRAAPGTTVVGPVRTAAELIAGYRQLIARAHANGIKIYGATLTPFEGVAPGYYSPEKDEIRIEINKWIRESGEYDGVIDFEAAVRDSAKPRIMKAEYDSGDHLHPGDVGYKAMAEFIDLSLFAK